MDCGGGEGVEEVFEFADCGLLVGGHGVVLRGFVWLWRRGLPCWYGDGGLFAWCRLCGGDRKTSSVWKPAGIPCGLWRAQRGRCVVVHFLLSKLRVGRREEFTPNHAVR